MADTKITALAAITTVDPAADVLPIVDISDTSMAASGTTKKITSNQILGAGGTATLASATITGDLTVDTSTLKVDSTNNRVGIVNASPAAALDILGGKDSTNTIIGAPLSTVGGGSFANYSELLFKNTSGSNSDASIRSYGNVWNAAGSQLAFFTSNNSAVTERYRIDNTGVSTWSVGGTTAMTLNSTGLGIGVTPSAWLAAVKALDIGSNAMGIFNGGITHNAYYDNTDGRWEYKGNGAATYWNIQGGIHQWYVAASGIANNPITTFANAAMTLDASGNLLCGSTALNATWNTRLTLSSDSGTTRWAVGPYSTATNFVISAASGGGVYLNGTAATSWTSASDERLKDIIEPISNAIAKVGSLRAVIGKFKSDDTNTRKSFLMAQDVQSVLPEAVDASNPDRLGLAYTDIIPLLVAAIKELTARVQTLEAK